VSPSQSVCAFFGLRIYPSRFVLLTESLGCVSEMEKITEVIADLHTAGKKELREVEAKVCACVQKRNPV